MPRVLEGSQGGGRFLMSEVPLHLQTHRMALLLLKDEVERAHDARNLVSKMETQSASRALIRRQRMPTSTALEHKRQSERARERATRARERESVCLCACVCE